MPPTVEDRLRDIAEAIAEIEQLVAGVDLAAFSSDRLLRLATERLLEIIYEASRNIPDSIKSESPTIHWRKMIDFGNLLRHAYHTTDVAVVWDVVAGELPALKTFVSGKLTDLK
ncbi:HepT-like ribonuclease domain-containing protein [Bradyrhizobium sp. HKCCYLS2058]|uniref:HepT-like ribonuclease domain-containing protein n=1 Tax=unclassified Bradyrhizobium TaxID=2631580 RepID=UPI003EBB61CE